MLTTLQQQGACYLERLEAWQTRELVEWFSSKPVYPDAHVPQHARNFNRPLVARSQLPSSCECFCTETDDAVLAPHVLERALSLTDFAARTLGVAVPKLYSANAFWTRPGPAGERADIQAFHVDKDDSQFLVMFVLLTDTNAIDGTADIQGPDGVVRPFFGPAGTIYLADTSYPHRGRKPLLRERGIMWFRWGVSDRPAANEWDRIQPVQAVRLGGRYPHNRRLRESLKLLAA